MLLWMISTHSGKNKKQTKKQNNLDSLLYYTGKDNYSQIKEMKEIKIIELLEKI